MNSNKRAIAAMELVLIFPAALFMTALVARHLQPLQYAAQQIVTWYSVRPWTLWVLLIGLPLVVLVTGCVALLCNRNGDRESRQAARKLPATIGAHLATRIIAAATLAAGGILAVVVVHMLAS